MKLGIATSLVFSSPAKTSDIFKAKSKAVPGPRLSKKTRDSIEDEHSYLYNESNFGLRPGSPKISDLDISSQPHMPPGNTTTLNSSSFTFSKDVSGLMTTSLEHFTGLSDKPATVTLI
ncbi:hypothetical protein GQX74_004971 [Glossina fuscipes]|nr:hypothetical protein GQX74_004971 [Glossina fuscipes]